MKRRLNNHDYKGFYWHARQNKMENLQSIREVYCGHEGNGIVSFEILPDIIPVEQGDLIFIEDTLETSLSHVFQVYPSFTWEVKGYEEKEPYMPITRILGVVWEKTVDKEKIVNVRPFTPLS